MALPDDLLVRSLLFLGSLQDNYSASLVSKQFYAVATSNAVWRGLAEHRFTSRIVNATSMLYSGDYKAMLKDDNIHGAIPTKNGLWKCAYKHNTTKYYFCCLVTQIQWDRPNGRVLLHLDARGERDLRHPQGSGIWRQMKGGGVERVLKPRERLVFANAMPKTVLGHYKGSLLVDDEILQEPGKYMFCFANFFSPFRDYEETNLFELQPGQSLRDVFDSYALRTEESPFRNDTEEIERERWRLHVPQAVLRRGGIAWWV